MKIPRTVGVVIRRIAIIMTGVTTMAIEAIESDFVFFLVDLLILKMVKLKILNYMSQCFFTSFCTY